MSEIIRCKWASVSEADIKYHDNEWGRPVHDDRRLYEKIVLESMQAGLSWSTILNKRENFRKAFDNFDPYKVALYNDEKKAELMANSGIIRNRLKINSAINNAQAYINLVDSGTTLADFLWRFVDYKPVINHWKRHEDIPAATDVSEKMAKALKKSGFTFVGPTTCYALMQSVGLVNDHLVDCFCWEIINNL